MANRFWLRALALALNEEFKYRFEKDMDHKSVLVVGQPVHAYRNFYVGEKSLFATWTKRGKPEWFV